MFGLNNKTFLNELKDYVSGILAGQFYTLVPSQVLKSQRVLDKILCSSLEVNKHFTSSALEPISVEVHWVREKLSDAITKHLDTVRPQFYATIGPCIGDILGNLSLLLGEHIQDVDGHSANNPGTIQSETELRFAVADPIAKMICRCWNYQVAMLHMHV